jgi:hypothetical protein
MRKLSKKTAWIFEMDVEAPKNEAGEIERILLKSSRPKQMSWSQRKQTLISLM